MAITLQSLAENNLAECFALSITDEEQNHAMLGPTPEIVTEVVEAMEGDESRVARVIYSDKTPVGFLDYARIPYDEGRYHIYHFFIDQNHRNRGYGEAALRLLVDELCQKPDCQQITVSYMSFNDSGALQLYEKLGFVENEAEEYEADRSATFHCRS